MSWLDRPLDTKLSTALTYLSLGLASWMLADQVGMSVWRSIVFATLVVASKRDV